MKGILMAFLVLHLSAVDGKDKRKECHLLSLSHLFSLSHVSSFHFKVGQENENGWVSLSSRVNESERKERANPSIKRVEPKGAVRDEALHGKVLCL